MRILILSFLFFFCIDCNLIQDPYPNLTSPVVDPAGFLPIDVKKKIEQRLLDEEKITTNQVVVYITNSLNKSSIEEEAITVFEKWKLGSKDKDNGVLFLLAPNDRKVRIEVGYGLEGDLTDLLTKRIINDIIIPNMKSRNLVDAVMLGTAAILDQLSGNSPSYLSSICPSTFNDKDGNLHPDTIPLLQKEIKTYSIFQFQFCVLPSETQWALESRATTLLLNSQMKKDRTKRVIFAVSPKNDYLGSIVTSPEFSWSLSKNKINEIFRKRYREKRNRDFTNYSYLSFLDMLTYLSHNNKQKIEAGSGVFDPHGVLEIFSYDRSTTTIKNIETDYNINTQILFLDTDSDIENESKKFHSSAFGKKPGITILFSLNHKTINIYTDKNSVVSSVTNQNPVAIDKKSLETKIINEIANDLKSSDIDWMSIRAAEATEQYLYNLIRDKKTISQNKESSVIADPKKEPHFLWKFYFGISFLILILAFLAGEGLLFFNALFFVLWQKFQYKVNFLLDSPNILQTIYFVSSIVFAFIVVLIFRKLGWAIKVHDGLNNFFSYSSGYSSTSPSSSYHSSGGSSSRSSYSGGGGRSGGGGASGSW